MALEGTLNRRAFVGDRGQWETSGGMSCHPARHKTRTDYSLGSPSRVKLS